MATQCGITIPGVQTRRSSLRRSPTASRETNLQLGKIPPDRSIHRLYSQLMDDSLSWNKKNPPAGQIWHREKWRTSVALLYLINVTIKSNHKLRVHRDSSQGTAWHLDNPVGLLVAKKTKHFYSFFLLSFFFLKKLCIAALLNLICKQRKKHLHKA